MNLRFRLRASVLVPAMLIGFGAISLALASLVGLAVISLALAKLTGPALPSAHNPP